MSGFFTEFTGGLTHLYCIFCNHKPLGTEFNNVAYSINGVFILLDISIVKNSTKDTKYHHDFGAAAACTKRGWKQKSG